MIALGAEQMENAALATTGFMLVFVRVGALLTATPVFRSTGIPTRVRLMFALAVSGLLFASLPPNYVTPTSAVELVPIVLWELALGFAMGFIVQMVFAALAVAGESVAMGMGLGFASLVDPQSGTSVPTVSQYFVLMASLLFVALNGHLLMLQMLFDSFTIIPPGSKSPLLNNPGIGIEWAATMYAHALFIALPVLVAMLLTNLAFGVITRAAPQLNIFAIGFPLMLVLGVVMILVNMEHLVSAAGDLFERAYLAVGRLLGAN